MFEQINKYEICVRCGVWMRTLAHLPCNTYDIMRFITRNTLPNTKCLWQFLNLKSPWKKDRLPKSKVQCCCVSFDDVFFFDKKMYSFEYGWWVNSIDRYWYKFDMLAASVHLKQKAVISSDKTYLVGHCHHHCLCYWVIFFSLEQINLTSSSLIDCVLSILTVSPSNYHTLVVFDLSTESIASRVKWRENGRAELVLSCQESKETYSKNGSTMIVHFSSALFTQM